MFLVNFKHCSNNLLIYVRVNLKAHPRFSNNKYRQFDFVFPGGKINNYLEDKDLDNAEEEDFVPEPPLDEF